MAIIKGLCELCSSNLDEISRRKVHDTEYIILECDKCKHVVARSDK